MRIRARHYATGDRVDVEIAKGRVVAVDEVLDLRSGPTQSPPTHEAGWIAPALFDIQINGCAGVSFNALDLTGDQIRQVVRICQTHGIGAFCPTLVTASPEALLHGFSTLARACGEDRLLAEALPAFHLEGPFLSAEDGPRGAHPLQWIRSPSFEEFQRYQDAARGRIRLVTLAPERDGAIALIEKLNAAGVVVAIGHTAATPEQVRTAAAAGATLSTHLGNGNHAMLPRHENYLWEQLAADGLWASLICDGHHLPPALIRCFLRIKSPARCILTCDASSLAGLSPGRYRQWDQDFDVLAEGKIIVPDTPFLAGSAAFTDACLNVAMRDGDVSLREAFDMASARPRALLGLEAWQLAPDSPANFTLFDHAPGEAIRVTGLVLDGALVCNDTGLPTPTQFAS